MNITEQPAPGLDAEPTSERSSTDAGSSDLSEQKISGFDGGTHSILKQPSLFLSIIVICVAMAACFGKTPGYFWLMTLSLIALTTLFHVIAEKLLIRVNSDFELFSIREGMLTVLFGSVLPGLGLLAYGLFALFNSSHINLFDELGKLVLLLIVPAFNFCVWSAIRRRYLLRPRLTGVMNGFAVGLSASWTVIWLKSAFIAHSADTRFGWMLLLCVSPVLLFSAVCMSVDLHRKTEPKISRIASTFSFLGCLLSVLFVFAPLTRVFYIQSLLSEIFNSTAADRPKLIANLREQATPEDLRPSKYPLSGFALSALLLGNKGLDGGSDNDCDVYFKVTGKPFTEPVKQTKTLQSDADRDSLDPDMQAISSVAGEKILGLSLAKSQMVGNVSASTMTGSVDWSMTFHNSTNCEQEARAIISLPRDAVASPVTLWINGEAREASVASPTKTRAASLAVERRSRDPLLVTMFAPGKILVQCFPVPVNSDTRIRIGFKIALESRDRKTCLLNVPRLVATNFAKPRRHQIQFESSAPFLPGIAGGIISQTADTHTLSGSIRETNDGKSAELPAIAVLRSTPFTAAATFDATSKHYVVESLKETVETAPKKLVVVIDSSASLQSHLTQLRSDLTKVSAIYKPLVYFAGETISGRGDVGVPHPVLWTQAHSILTENTFVGGQDNRLALTEALELASETPQGAVLWIHGPQPLSQDISGASPLDLVHKVCLYDMQVEPGPNQVLHAISVQDPLLMVKRQSIGVDHTITDVAALVKSWTHPEKLLVIQRTPSMNKPDVEIVGDAAASAQVASLWANDEVTRLLASGFERKAVILASDYRLVSAETGAVVLDRIEEFNRKATPSISHRDAARGAVPVLFYNSQSTSALSNGGLFSHVVDPRYGQSSENDAVSYDTMRDILNWVTGLSLLTALVFGFASVRLQKVLSFRVLLGASLKICLIPFAVHMLGSYLINNFGGLGGGL